MRIAYWQTVAAALLTAGWSSGAVQAAEPGIGAPVAQPESWTSKLAKAFTPPADKDAELPTAEKPKKTGPDLFVAMAQFQERKGNLDEAEKQYRLALKNDPKYLPALVGLAHLHDHRGQLEAAVKQYQQTIAKHPKEAAVHNDLGLCYHRRRMFKEAIASLQKAVELKPEKALYRNNLATVLVETDQINEALAQLTKAHGPAKAHYNLGYLLQQKGRTPEAIAYFQMAISIDPKFKPAHEWLAHLQPRAGEARPAAPEFTAQVSDGGQRTPGKVERLPPTVHQGTAQPAPEPTPWPDYLRSSNARPATAPPARSTANPNVRLPQPGAKGSGGAVPPSPNQAVIDDLEPLPAVGP